MDGQHFTRVVVQNIEILESRFNSQSPIWEMIIQVNEPKKKTFNMYITKKFGTSVLLFLFFELVQLFLLFFWGGMRVVFEGFFGVWTEPSLIPQYGYSSSKKVRISYVPVWINSHYFHIIEDGKINPIVRVYTHYEDSY